LGGASSSISFSLLDSLLIMVCLFVINPQRPAFVAGCGVAAHLLGMGQSFGYAGYWLDSNNFEKTSEFNRPEVLSV
jgi:hypothetical protein